jgi:hypothetical protein
MRGEPVKMLSASLVPVEVDRQSWAHFAKNLNGDAHRCLESICDLEKDPLSKLIAGEDEIRRRKLATMVASEASQLARVQGWEFVELMLRSSVSVSQVSEQLQIPRTTLRDRLKWLGQQIASSATPEMDALGREILGKSWEKAARRATVGHRNRRGAAFPLNIGSVTGERGIFPATLAANQSIEPANCNHVMISV